MKQEFTDNISTQSGPSSGQISPKQKNEQTNIITFTHITQKTNFAFMYKTFKPGNIKPKREMVKQPGSLFPRLVEAMVRQLRWIIQIKTNRRVC